MSENDYAEMAGELAFQYVKAELATDFVSVIAAELAAAEERGRRRGVEEAARYIDTELARAVQSGRVDPGPRALSRGVRALAPRDSAPVSAKDRAHALDVADRYERGEYHCKCGKPITAEHPRCP